MRTRTRYEVVQYGWHGMTILAVGLEPAPCGLCGLLIADEAEHARACLAEQESGSG